jgi:hypothetical protein
MSPQQVITLVICEILPQPGHDYHGHKYRAALADGGLILAASTQPFHDGARELLKRGFDPNSTLIMKRASTDVIAMRGVLGEVARMAMRESPTRGPDYARYVPYKQADAVSAVERGSIISARRCRTAANSHC